MPLEAGSPEFDRCIDESVRTALCALMIRKDGWKRVAKRAKRWQTQQLQAWQAEALGSIGIGGHHRKVMLAPLDKWDYTADADFTPVIARTIHLSAKHFWAAMDQVFTVPYPASAFRQAPAPVSD